MHSSGDLYGRLNVGHWQIRILEILPGDLGALLETELHVADLLHGPEVRIDGKKEAVSYAALSYVWGDGCELVRCNGIDCYVTTSASLGLQQLRSSKYQYVWLDSLCINQEDYEDKNQQVPKMLTIYSKAREVIIWLGKGSNNINRLLYDLERASAVGNAQFRILESDGSLEILDDGYVVNTPETSLCAMEDFLDLDWFTRLWTKQEIWAARRAFLCYDGQFCEWENFNKNRFERVVDDSSVQKTDKYRSVIERLERVCAQHVRGNFLAIAHAQADQAIDDKNEFLEDCEGRELDIVNVVRRCSGSNCSDHHDYIYGVLGMSTVKRYNDDDYSGKPMLSINYGQSIAQTFEDLTRYILERDDNLSVLLLEDAFTRRDQDPTHNERLPSWVPDWRFSYGDLGWLTSFMDRPLSARVLPTVQAGRELEKGVNIFEAHINVPLAIQGFTIGQVTELDYTFYEKYEPWPKSINGMRPALITLDESFLSEARQSSFPDMLPLPDTDTRFACERLDLACVATQRMRIGDLAVGVHGAYTALLLRSQGNTRGEQFYEYIGPVVFDGPGRSTNPHARGPAYEDHCYFWNNGWTVSYFLADHLANKSTQFQVYHLI